MGRFLSRDTWPLDTWHPVELNRYVYAAGNPVTWSDPSGRMAVEIATLETKITLEDLVILGLLGYATTCVYYFTYISVLQVAGFDVSFVRALAPDGCEPPERDRDRKRRDCDPMVDEECACEDENSPLYDPEECEDCGSKNLIRVRHYTKALFSLKRSMTIGPNVFKIYVEYPITTPRTEDDFVATYESFGKSGEQLNGAVEFNVDTDKYQWGPDPWLNGNAIEIDIPVENVIAGRGFPLDEPCVDPKFFDRCGNPVE